MRPDAKPARRGEPSRSRLTAVLGPTNTGKTFFAVERMLGHSSGMMGFPLRLLARENYERIVKARGSRAVALVTGEEKIVPPNPAYFVCTVESMPLERRVAFLAVDEVQLAADPERGHVFSDRLLHARGDEETMFLGSETIMPLIRTLLPGIEFVTRPRFSSLSYAGPKRISRLPRRSALIAFTAGDVYAFAEYLRRVQGGAAVVFGALSPRARNAQVAMFQAGEVDYLVATDAIGMGLNLDLNHVAFARLEKFDGIRTRRLGAPEIAQIAGRAGRHMSDGTFGTTSEIGPLDPGTVETVESHNFEKLKSVFWRNVDLDFSSPQALLASLDRPPPAPGLLPVRGSQDYLALSALSRDPEIKKLARDRDSVRLLWEVCRIPDFLKNLSDEHARLLTRVYRHLMAPAASLPVDWVARQVARLERTDGDIDTLAARLAHIRTWNYIAFHGGWLADPAHWQGRTLVIEDRLSDALHERLTERFVDVRAAVLVRRMAEGDRLLARVGESGEVIVEGHFVGRLNGFRFEADASAPPEEARALFNAARRALRDEIAERVNRAAADADGAFSLLSNGLLAWCGQEVARLAPGPDLLTPRVEPLPSDLLEVKDRERIRRRFASWFESYLKRKLGPLFRAASGRSSLSGAARGIVFQLGERLGSLPRGSCAAQIDALTPADRKALAGLGIRLGRDCVYLPALVKPQAVRLRAFLWGIRNQRAILPCGVSSGASPGTPIDALFDPKAGNASLPVVRDLPPDFYEAAGYRVFRGREGCGRALRVDIVEKLLGEAWRLGRQGAFAPTSALMSLAGCGPLDLVPVFTAFGFRAVVEPNGVTFRLKRDRRGENSKGKQRSSGSRKPRKLRSGKESPFARLRDLRGNL